MAKRQEQADTRVRYTALLPPAYVEQLRFLAAAGGLNGVLYTEVPRLHGPDTETPSDKPDMRYYIAEYGSFAAWERLHAAMDQVVEHAFQEMSRPDTHSAA